MNLGTIIGSSLATLFVVAAYLMYFGPSVDHDVVVVNRSADVAEVSLIHYIRDDEITSVSVPEDGRATVVGKIGCIGRFRVALRNADGDELGRTDVLHVSTGWFGPRFSARLAIAEDNSIAYTPAHSNFCNIS